MLTSGMIAPPIGRLRCVCFAAMMLLSGAAAAVGAEVIELSTRSSSATDAKCAFVRSFEQEKWTSPAGIAQLQSFAGRKGMFFPAAHLATYYADLPALAEALVQQPTPLAKPMAAALVAFAALGDHLQDEKHAALSQVVVEDHSTDAAPAPDQVGMKKGKRARKVFRCKVPAALFGDKSATTLELAVLAAAYTADAAVRELVDAVPAAKDDSGIIGAKLLYHARLGDPLTAAQVAAAFVPAKSPGAAVTTATPELANFNLLLPKEAYACEALGILRAREHLEHLHQMLAHPDLRVQVEAVKALHQIGSRDSLPWLVKRLETCEWPVLVQVCAALGALPAKESVPPLIARLKRETGRFRLDVIHALSCIAGNQVAENARDWQTWWDKDGGRFQVDETQSKTFRGSHRPQDMAVPALGSFYGLDICSDHFAYVVDSSNSMIGARMESLRTNMSDSITGLTQGVNFNIVDFGGTVVAMNRNGLTTNKRSGIGRMKDLKLSLGTRVYDAIEEAAGLEEIDTLFLLTDGQPVKGQLNRWPHLYRAITIMNRHRPLAIFTVAFQPTPAARQALKQMADENWGLTIEAN